MTPERRTGTQSIERALDILRVVAMGGRTGMRLKEIVAAAGLAEATVVRIVQGLVASGMLARNERSSRIVFGQLAHEFGMLTAHETSLDVAHWRPVVLDLAAITGETIYLNRRNGFDSVCMDVAMGAQPVQAHPIDVGVRRPLGAGAGGLAILMALPQEEVARCLARNASRYPYYGLDAAGVQALVDGGRARGYALLQALTIRGVSVVGLPVPGPVPYLSVCVSGLSTRLSGPVLDETAAMLRERLDREARRLGLID
ncbi:IclR family transcriptional regulator [Cupriavidus plantarum]|uniref:IclR family transcriptional regulator n=1 Tax=Cupriavidus plantarum TaxID=942865 RepID=A0A316EZU8_9BURK|nr:helix-turn-helix domain-containing protein [Cupriavidus plantarum]NYH98594.1 DNA-binding IclR family transcriptional regulator [Cupriavidus plantarum]PWK37776.1 IclR family transcriptional regulator [Cupriavidus plantarum]REF01518.1 IclR family transcriptional regulator [Cupriavidus plantarum]RLK45619.1 IclR family transcriptional regulator [Cupriavidus plantarum]CAG2128024.1 hypothetical protein LMG26296_01070 [Cupriavidus plantarum]